MRSICFNGKMIAENEPVLLASNRSYRYGDGLFETMKMRQGRLLLQEYHFDRLFAGISLLGYSVPSLFTVQQLEDNILAVCKKNDCMNLARIRLSVFPGNGGLYDDDRSLQYLIEAGPLEQEGFNDNGLVTGIYPGAKKTCDVFANLKSSSFQVYSLAAMYARQHKWNDAIVLNQHDRIADATIANVFIIKDKVIYTPALAEGCINGVMRRHLLEMLPREGYIVKETSLQTSGLEDADEMFFSNAIRGIRWVRQFGDKLYSSEQSRQISPLLP